MKYTIFRGSGDSRQYSETGRCNSNATGSHFLDIEGKDWAVCQEGWGDSKDPQFQQQLSRRSDGILAIKRNEIGSFVEK